jgi:Poly(R)-hydroxyalkanoic acid synthase subunit (PHA_synth_III_E)
MAAGKQQAPWLEFVQRWERAIGEPLESFLHSDTYFDLTTQAKRARAKLTKSLEETMERWLHLFNLPAATDVRRLHEQLSRLERAVNRLAKDVADQAEGPEAAKPKPRPKRAAPKKKP